MSKKPLMKTLEELALIIVTVVILSLFVAVLKALLPAWGVSTILFLLLCTLVYLMYRQNKKRY